MSKRSNQRIEKKEAKRKISESNRVGFLKQSKKYAAGREYNTLEGRIKIINRYLENGEIMISFLNMQTDKIILMNELDVNSMLYRYNNEIAKKAQGDFVEARQGKYTLEVDEDLREQSEALERHNKELEKQVENLERIVDLQKKLIDTLMEQLKRG